MNNNKLNMFISDDKRLELIIKSLHLSINKEEHKHLINELYRHIEHTRIFSFKNGYDQGRFDEKMDMY